MNKGKLLFSVTQNDCEWEFFNPGRGPGGQKRNKTSNGVRVYHPESGAKAQATESRSQYKNRKTAFKRMAETIEFKIWLTRKLASGPTPEEIVEKDMQTQNLRIEGREDGKWVELKS